MKKRNGLQHYNFKLDQLFWEAIKPDVRLDIKYITTDRQINKQLTEPKETRCTHPIQVPLTRKTILIRTFDQTDRRTAPGISYKHNYIVKTNSDIPSKSDAPILTPSYLRCFLHDKTHTKTNTDPNKGVKASPWTLSSSSSTTRLIAQEYYDRV
jgi:hypothetical protein